MLFASWRAPLLITTGKGGGSSEKRSAARFIRMASCETCSGTGKPGEANRLLQCEKRLVPLSEPDWPYGPTQKRRPFSSRSVQRKSARLGATNIGGAPSAMAYTGDSAADRSSANRYPSVSATTRKRVS